MNELDKLREEIDLIDSEIVRLFSERMAVSEKIGDYKRKNGLPVLDKTRENEKLDAIEGGVDPELKPYIRELYEKIFSLSRDKQKK